MNWKSVADAEDHRKVSLVVMLFFVVTLFVPVATAGAQQEAASIVGQVVDTSGAVLPGVTVTATSPALQAGEMTTVTDGRGQYRLTPLSIGVYTVRFNLDGFQSIVREGITLTVGFTARIDARMDIGTLEEAIVVTGASPVVDTTSTVTGTVLTKETLELLPTSRSGVTSLMAQAPGVRPLLDVAGDTMNSVPEFRAFGISGQSWQTVEGVPTANGRTNNASGTFWDYTSFEQAKVESLAHNADTPLVGVYLNGVVKSGGNDFHGTAYASGTSDRFQSSNIDANLEAQGITEGGALRYRRDVPGRFGRPHRPESAVVLW